MQYSGTYTVSEKRPVHAERMLNSRRTDFNNSSTAMFLDELQKNANKVCIIIR